MDDCCYLERHASRCAGRHDTAAVDIVNDEAALSALEPEWRELWERDPAATPFQSPAWLMPWVRIFAGPDWLVATMRCRGRLIAVLPLFLVEDDHGRRLMSMGAGISDYGDGVFDPEVGCEAASIDRAKEWRRSSSCKFPITLLSARPEGWTMSAFDRTRPEMRFRSSVAPHAAEPAVTATVERNGIEHASTSVMRRLRAGVPSRCMARAGEARVARRSRDDKIRPSIVRRFRPRRRRSAAHACTTSARNASCGRLHADGEGPYLRLHHRLRP
jgi:CelD/BcsL family acetyltransferase involved in cellulose biosynthesis